MSQQKMNQYSSRTIPKQISKNFVHKNSGGVHQENSIIQDINQLDKYIINHDISSIQGNTGEYFGGNEFSKKQFRDIKEYENQKIKQYQIYEDSYGQQMVLLPKQKYLELIRETKLLKKAMKSQYKMFSQQIQNLRQNVERNNMQRLLLHKQKQYLNDLKRTQSEPKLFTKHQGSKNQHI